MEHTVVSLHFSKVQQPEIKLVSMISKVLLALASVNAVYGVGISGKNKKKKKGKSKEDDLARIADKKESIDFKTLGTASEDDKDDLKNIKGIGPFLEQKLNALGIYTYKQISNMTPELEDKVNEAIEFFPGRIRRDEWTKQASEFIKIN